MADIYTVGTRVKITAVFKNNNAVADPTTIYFQVKDPSGNIATYSYADAELTKVSTGKYTYNLTLDEEGYWYIKTVGLGTVVSASRDILIKAENTTFSYPPG